MKLAQLRHAGHWPTLLTSFLYFDVSFMVWTILGALGAQIGGRDEIARALDRDLQLLDFAEIAVEGAGRLERGIRHDIDDR